jgi:hypothetical protein
VEFGAGADPLPGAEQGPPFAWIRFVEEQDFDGATPDHFSPPEAGRDDPGVVENEEITRAKPAPQLGETVELAGSAPSVQDQQARSIPLGGRTLSDELGRKVEIEVRNQHGGSRKAQGDGLG